MRWTPERLADVRARAVAATAHLTEHGVPWTTGAWVLAAMGLLGVSCLCWDRALASAGAPALRPLHDLTCALWRSANDPPLGVVPDDDDPLD